MKRLFIAAAAVCAIATLPPAFAHSSSNSFITVTSQPDLIRLRVDLPIRDIELRFDLDRDRNGKITWAELQEAAPQITPWVIAGVSLSTGDAPCQFGVADWAAAQYADENYLSLEMPVSCQGIAQAPAALTSLPSPATQAAERAAERPAIAEFNVRYTLLFDQDELHRGLVKVIVGSDTASAVLSPTQPQQRITTGPSSALSVFINYLVEGVWHIWIGLDHILFLLSLLLPCVFIRAASRIGQWRPVVNLRPALINVLAVVTAFTVAHSITLSLAVLQILNPPSSLIEPIIAASVVLAAASNLTQGLIHLRWQMAFIFGLIHGFGFASVLADLGLPSDQLVVALLSFNVGVELGQLAIVLAFFPLAWFLRGTAFYRWGLVVGGSVLIALVATVWLVQRLMG
jgi:hypothetical protein